MAKAFGCTVIVTVGANDKGRACLGLGADHFINYKTQDFAQESLRLTKGAGVNVVLDIVGGAYIGREVQCLTNDGRLALIATQGGNDSAFDSGMVLRKRLSITGSTLRPRPLAYKAMLARGLRERVWPLVEAGRVRPVVHSVFQADSPDGAANAHRLMESSKHVGKIMLCW
jgi:NADPH2:quinone reductase